MRKICEYSLYNLSVPWKGDPHKLNIQNKHFNSLIYHKTSTQCLQYFLNNKHICKMCQAHYQQPVPLMWIRISSEFRGVRWETVVSPTLSNKSFSTSVGATPKIPGVTPDFEVSHLRWMIVNRMSLSWFIFTSKFFEHYLWIFFSCLNFRKPHLDCFSATPRSQKSGVELRNLGVAQKKLCVSGEK